MRRLRIAERPDWRQQADRLGFRFHTIDGAAYWDESACYAFSLREIEDGIEQATRDVHAMAMDLVAQAVDSEELLERLCIPPTHWDWVRASWKRSDPHLYGRMDFAYDGTGAARLYELNYDTPTALYEAAYFQWLWLEQQVAAGRLPAGADQFNTIQELLCEAFAALALAGRIGKRLHFAALRDTLEDQGTIEYLRDCAHQAGIATTTLAIEDIGISEDGWFTDLDDRVIRTLFKLYPLEWMMRDGFGLCLAMDTMQLIEPAWKAILSNKGVLPLLWERHPGHPNLLPARFDDDPDRPVATGWVRKRLFSREGANIEMATWQGERIRSPGTYAQAPAILQAFHPLPSFDGNHPVVGSWVVADQPAGIGMREDATLITRNTSRFVPHAILD